MGHQFNRRGISFGMQLIETHRFTLPELVLHNLLISAPSQHKSISTLFERIVKKNFTKQDAVTLPASQTALTHVLLSHRTLGFSEPIHKH